jgi:hypothetical protein
MCPRCSGSASSDIRLGFFAASAVRMERGHHPASVRIHRSVESVADIVARSPRDRFLCWTVSTACTLGGRSSGGSSDVLVLPGADNLDSMAEQVHGNRRTTMFAALKSGAYSGKTRVYQSPLGEGGTLAGWALPTSDWPRRPS